MHKNNVESVPDYLIEEPFEQYRKAADGLITSHKIMDFYKCPLLYRKRLLGLVPDGGDSESFRIGRATHSLILEGEAVYESTYAIGGPINPATGKPYGSDSKKFQEWAEGKPAVSYADDMRARGMAEMVHGNAECAKLLSVGWPERVVRTARKQIRMDWFHPTIGIVDLKTCDDIKRFERFGFWEYLYKIQLAFYQNLMHDVTGEWFPVHVIAVQKKEPYICCAYEVTPGTLDSGREAMFRALDRMADCYDGDRWPTGYERKRTLDIEKHSSNTEKGR